MLKTSIWDFEKLSMVTYLFYFINWQSMHKTYRMQRLEHISIWEVFVCLIWFFTSQSTFVSHVGTGLPGLNQYLAEDKVSCSRTQHNASGEARTVESIIKLSETQNNLFPGTWLSMNFVIRQTILILPSLGASTPGVFSLSAILLEKNIKYARVPIAWLSCFKTEDLEFKCAI